MDPPARAIPSRAALASVADAEVPGRFTFSIVDWPRCRMPTRVRSVTDSAGTTDLGSATYE
jgi:hypothetical protein